jgi:hypothetical protein
MSAFADSDELGSVTFTCWVTLDHSNVAKSWSWGSASALAIPSPVFQLVGGPA